MGGQMGIRAVGLIISQIQFVPRFLYAPYQDPMKTPMQMGTIADFLKAKKTVNNGFAKDIKRVIPTFLIFVYDLHILYNKFKE
jgi:hypothetical protein